MNLIINAKKSEENVFSLLRCWSYSIHIGVDTGKAPISYVYMSVAPPKHEVMKNTFNRDINSACAQTGEFNNKKGKSWAA